VLEENVDLLVARFPYFVERCISVLARAVQMQVHVQVQMQLQGNGKHETFKDLLPDKEHINTENGSCEDVWASMKLLRGIPSDFVAHISDRLACSMHELLEYVVFVFALLLL
jgi:hypothetical protein